MLLALDDIMDLQVVIAIMVVIAIIMSAIGGLFVSASASTLLRVRVHYLRGAIVCLFANFAPLLGLYLFNAIIEIPDIDPSVSRLNPRLVLGLVIWLSVGAYASGYFIEIKASPLKLNTEKVRIGLKKGIYVWLGAIVLYAVAYGLFLGFISLLR